MNITRDHDGVEMVEIRGKLYALSFVSEAAENYVQPVAEAAARNAALEAGLTRAADFLDALHVRMSQQGFYAQADQVEDAANAARAALQRNGET